MRVLSRFAARLARIKHNEPQPSGGGEMARGSRVGFLMVLALALALGHAAVNVSQPEGLRKQWPATERTWTVRAEVGSRRLIMTTCTGGPLHVCRMHANACFCILVPGVGLVVGVCCRRLCSLVLRDHGRGLVPRLFWSL
jgi:hypothetical protein